jgi:hypothetical protein
MKGVLKLDKIDYAKVPDELEGENQLFWKDVVSEFELDHYSWITLKQALIYKQKADKLSELIDQEGCAIETLRGIKTNPKIDLMNKYIQAYARFLKESGFKVK